MKCKHYISGLFQLRNCTEIVRNNRQLLSQSDSGCYLLIFDRDSLKDNCILTKSVKEKMQKVAAQYPHAKLIQSTVRTKDWVDKMSKVFSEEEAINILKAFNIGDESVLFIASGPRDHAVSINCLFFFLNFVTLINYICKVCFYF